MRRLLTIVPMLFTLGLFASGDQDPFETIETLSTLYVKADAIGRGDGTSWQNAYTDLNYALGAARSGSEIWVARGTYTPSKGDSSVSFMMKDGVDLYGGFDGSETERSERDWLTNVTTLSGEIGDISRVEDNSLSVVMAANSIIDGFTISGGYGVRQGGMGAPEGEMGPPPEGMGDQGSGQVNQMSGPPSGQSGRPSGPPPGQSGGQSRGEGGGPGVNQEQAGHSSPDQIMGAEGQPGNGAGIQIWQVSPEIRNCTIVNNQAGKGGGIYIVGERVGRAQQTQPAVEPVFFNCYIGDNIASGRGGGASLDLGASAVFVDCVFENNTCLEGKGGAVYNDFGCSPYFANCLFAGNRADSGGAMANDGSSSPTLLNTTLVDNEALVAGAALYQGSGPYNDPVVINSVIWGNLCPEDEASVYNWHECNTQISHSIVEGGYEGESVLSVDPLFLKDGNNTFVSTSPAWTAGREGSPAGYDPTLSGGRSEAEIVDLIKKVKSLPKAPNPIPLELKNPLVSAEALNDRVLYVTEEGTGRGTSWSDSTSSLQDAINWANYAYLDGGVPVYIWVAQGTYYPGDSREDSFVLREGVILYGGFEGTEKTIFMRDAEKFKAILSGNIGDTDRADDNSYHVLIGADKVVIDGFTITGGYADGVGGEVYDNKGGALLNYKAGNRVKPSYTPTLGFDMTLLNCNFVNNYAVEGGAVYTYHGGNPVFENCQFENNEAHYGGAVVDRAGTDSSYTNCRFVGNVAKYKGGALFVDYGSMAAISKSVLSGNSAGASGGAIYVIDRASQEIPNQTSFALIDPSWTNDEDIFSAVYLGDSTLVDNRAGRDGGALFVYEQSIAKVSNTTFEGNLAEGWGHSVCLINKSSLTLAESLSPSDRGIYKDETSRVNEE